MLVIHVPLIKRIEMKSLMSEGSSSRVTRGCERGGVKTSISYLYHFVNVI